MTKRLTRGEAAGCIAKDRLSRAAKRQQLERIVGPPPRSSPLYGHGSAGHGAVVLQVGCGPDIKLFKAKSFRYWPIRPLVKVPYVFFKKVGVLWTDQSFIDTHWPLCA